MSSAEQKKHSILMQERWDLIQSGVLRKDIKIRGDSLYVSNKKYGCALNSKFELCSNSIQSSSLALEEIIFPFKLYWKNVELLLALKCTMEL